MAEERAGFGSITQGGLRMTSLPMRLFIDGPPGRPRPRSRAGERLRR